ncbi:hypothetical protein SNE40_006754 [Patella caerulea]|uniref:SOCS box domain-containing protein n=1 Tax=Patella caerulea TaxID=87958 RepID=A0AAN8K1R4_PATCE
MRTGCGKRIMGLCYSVESLVEACENLDAEAIQRLVEEGHNVNQVTFEWEGTCHLASCLHVCLSVPVRPKNQKLRQRCLEILLQEGADPNQRNHRGETPIMIAESYNDTDSIQQLIAAGGDVKKLSYNGKTALFNAILGGRVETAEVLLRAGADINEKFPGYKGFILQAAKQGNTSVLRYLIKAGCDINQTCGDRGASALHYSILSGRNVLEVLQVLIDEGIDINIMDNAGGRPIHWAMFMKDKAVVRYLLAQNADINSPTMSNQSILDNIYCLGLTGFMKDCGYMAGYSKDRKIVFKSLPSLTSCCRKTIRRQIGCNADVKIVFLPLPNSLKQYLHLQMYPDPDV